MRLHTLMTPLANILNGSKRKLEPLRRLGPAFGLIAVLGGCAGNAPHYYSLQGADKSSQSNAPVGGSYAISVQPVVIPQQVARPQIVLSMEEGSEVVPLNSALWVGPLEAQIRSVLAEELSQRLNVLDVGEGRFSEGLPVWRISLDVRRFDSLYAREVQQDVVWRLVPLGLPSESKERVCSAQVTRPVAGGMSALVQGHREALAGVAAAIARSLPTADANVKSAQALPEGVSFRGCLG